MTHWLRDTSTNRHGAAQVLNACLYTVSDAFPIVIGWDATCVDGDRCFANRIHIRNWLC